MAGCRARSGGVSAAIIACVMCAINERPAFAKVFEIPRKRGLTKHRNYAKMIKLFIS